MNDQIFAGAAPLPDDTITLTPNDKIGVGICGLGDQLGVVAHFNTGLGHFALTLTPEQAVAMMVAIRIIVEAPDEQIAEAARGLGYTKDDDQ